MNPILEVESLSFGYNGKKVLDNASFQIEKGDFAGVVGANGSGKSTLIKLMVKILTPNHGQIRLMGENIQTFQKWHKIGYISQKANAFNGAFPATVEEIVEANLYSQIGLFKRPSTKHKELVQNALLQVGMHNERKRLIGQLSGGQQQRVFIARVLVSQPEILFLDEPTVGIDAKSEEAVYCLLARLNQELGITVVMVTHDIGAITVHANKLICMGENGVILHDACEPMTREAISELYGYNIHLHSHACTHCDKRTQRDGSSVHKA